MITINITEGERGQIQYLLPIQGNLKTLEFVQQILDKTNITTGNGMIDFSEDEFDFICKMIDILNESQKLNLSCLSLVKKILNNKEN